VDVGDFYSTAEPWGIDIPPLPQVVVFHLPTEGRAVIEVEGERHPLRAGRSDPFA
jgi:hypothetical protein